MRYKKKMIGYSLLGFLLVIGVFLGYEYWLFQSEMKMMSQSLEENASRIETTYGTLEFAVKGSGDPILVIHGAGGGYDQGLLLAETFSKDQALLIAVSRPGFLGTPLTGINETPMNHADMYVELLDQLGIEKVNVLAFSDGGPSAIQMAIRHSDRCQSLTLVACKSKSPPPETLVQSLVFGNIFKADFLFWMIAKYQKNALLKVFGTSGDIQDEMTVGEKKLIEDFLVAMQPMSLRTDGIYNERKHMSNLDPDEYDLTKIVVPTLIIHAKDDSLQSFDYATYSASHIPNVQLISYETGGHMLIGHHEEVNAIFIRFISDL